MVDEELKLKSLKGKIYNKKGKIKLNNILNYILFFLDFEYSILIEYSLIVFLFDMILISET